MRPDITPEERLQKRQDAEVARAKQVLDEHRTHRTEFRKKHKPIPGAGYAALARADATIATHARHREFPGTDWRLSTVDAMRWFVLAVTAGYAFRDEDLRRFQALATSNLTELRNAMEEALKL